MSDEVFIDSGMGFNWSAIPSAETSINSGDDKMRVWFTKTSYYSGCGNVREFNNLDEAITCLLEECSKDGKYARNPELIIYKDDYTKDNKCDYTIEFYDDWRE